MTLSRREFVSVTAAAGLAAALPPAVQPFHRDRLKRIGIQLYTVRQALDANFAHTLERLAAIGYQEVEFAWNRGASTEGTRQLLRQVGLKAPAAHLAAADFGSGWEATQRAAHTLGIEYLVLAGIDGKEGMTLADYQQLATRFNEFGRRAHAAGFRFAYHNHAAELTPIEGERPYDILLANTDQGTVSFEMDIYWMLAGGGDPLEYFARWPGRFPLLHIKGRAADGQMVDVGAGAVDWATIFSKSKEAGVRHCFVEHDEPADAFASAQASYTYLRDLRFSAG